MFVRTAPQKSPPKSIIFSVSLPNIHPFRSQTSIPSVHSSVRRSIPSIHFQPSIPPFAAPFHPSIHPSIPPFTAPFHPSIHPSVPPFAFPFHPSISIRPFLRSPFHSIYSSIHVFIHHIRSHFRSEMNHTNPFAFLLLAQVYNRAAWDRHGSG